MTSPIIFGAGLSGLIAARMLQDLKPMILERQSSLPNNHAAVLRFRDETVSLATNIPFHKVTVLKQVCKSEGPIVDSIKYSRKVTRGYSSRSIRNLDPVERYIAPPDIVSRLAVGANICYSEDFLTWSHNLARDHGPIISTLPMPMVMDIFKWKDKPEFSYSAGWTITADIHPGVPCDLHCTIYYPTLFPFYRASITGRKLMVEGVGDAVVNTPGYQANCAAETFGIETDLLVNVEFKKASYQKISDLSLDDKEKAKRFVMWLSDKHQIYSLGRFATWRPKLLLDDIPNDVRVIRRLIEGQTNYRARIES